VSRETSVKPSDQDVGKPEEDGAPCSMQLRDAGGSSLTIVYTCGDCGADCWPLAPGRSSRGHVTHVVRCTECGARWVIAVEMLRADAGRLNCALGSKGAPRVKVAAVMGGV